jgi:uncharacterized CHY-type Zn-finger protein
MSDKKDSVIEMICEVCGGGVPFEEYKDVYYCKKCWAELVEKLENKIADATVDEMRMEVNKVD